MKKLVLYLAHPRNSRERIRKWEKKLERKYRLQLINPFYDVKDRMVNPDINTHERIELIKKHYKDVVETDIREIANSKGIVAIFDENTQMGTSQEMVYARILNKPVYSLVTNGLETHPWMLYHSDKIFTNEKGLEEFLYLISRKKRIYP